MKGILQFMRTTLVGGLLFLVPLIALAVVIEKAVALAHSLVAPLAAHLPFESIIGLKTPVFVAVCLIVVFCFIAGLFARGAIAQKIVAALERLMLSKVPGYVLLKGMSESMLGVEKQSGLPVVQVCFDDSHQLALEIERLGNGLVAVYVPGAPNPQSGAVYFVTPERVFPTKLPLASLMHCLNRLGAGSGEVLSGINTAGPARAGHIEERVPSQGSSR